MVLEYAGPSLGALLKQGPMPQAAVLPAALQLQGALRAIHGLGVLHLDLKPANILWSSDLGQLKLADFGMSERTGSKLEDLRYGEYVTAPYRPPELWDAEASGLAEMIKPAVDFWSFGCVLYEMVTARMLMAPARSKKFGTVKAAVRAWCVCWELLHGKANGKRYANDNENTVFHARIMAVGSWKHSLLQAMCPTGADRAVKVLAE